MRTVDQPFHGDRPIEAPGEDRLGFSLPAKHVARAIHRMASPDGFVIGIEGEWGSGKSSFTNLVSDALSQLEYAPEVIRFLPWLIRSREGLLKELFSEINKAAVHIETDELPLGWWAGALAKVWPRRYSARAIRRARLRALFSRFSSRLIQAGKLVDLFALPGAGVAAEAGKRSIDEWLANASLDKEKSDIQKELRKLKRKIVVFIDDLDRLDPHEVAEVLRLVRAVVDFPGVVFVLCYSQEIVAKNLSSAFHLQRGDDYLDKIIQVSFPVPQPEAFDLRRMFRHEIQLLYPDLLEGESDRARSSRDRLAEVIDGEGGRALLTPRHVVRAVNALRFHATSVLSNIDIPDMVWLQLIRMQSPKLHKWIEEYLIGFDARHNGAMITEESKNAELLELNAILEEMGSASSSRDARRMALTSALPGVDFDFERVDGKSTMVLTLYGAEDISELVQERRLGSPQHYRYYFALSAPKNSISDREFSIFLESAQSSPEAAVAQFTRLAKTLTSQGRVAAQALMDRLKGSGIRAVPENALPGVLRSLADSMDAAALTSGRGDWGEYWVWREGEDILEAVWPRLPANMRTHMANQMFGSGRSIAWLTEIFRTESSAHGISGTRRKPESDWLFSTEELDIAAAELVRRYRALTPDDLDRLPRIAPLLFAWKQHEPQSLYEIQTKVAQLCRNDADLLKFLQGMRSWKSSNGVVSYPLWESSLSPFMDIGRLRNRLLAVSSACDPSNAAEALELLDAIAKDEDD
ncbi:P-loop NTPase fold protein [Frateuria sp. GZRR35]|uniref:KAP family P-loop NTPase fold protein n=1 Tax=Frateuria sp. GZRR35 TaxID=3351536 RepID=UPI003EDBD53D